MYFGEVSELRLKLPIGVTKGKNFNTGSLQQYNNHLYLYSELHFTDRKKYIEYWLLEITS